MNQLIKTFCDIDDFCNEYEIICQNCLTDSEYKATIPKTSMFVSEIMTILVNFHTSRFRDFNHHTYSCSC